MSGFEILQIMAVLYFIFGVVLKMWKVSLSTFVVITLAFVVVVSEQMESIYCIYENRTYLFAAVLTFLFTYTSYRSILGKYSRIYKLNKMVKDSKLLADTIGNTIPDMLWAKCINGRYIYANTAIKDGLLFEVNPIGTTDIECAARAKLMFGEDNHTFGEKCANSDKIVLESLKPQRFLESGMVKGKMVYLEVNKAPLYDSEGKLIGVCGTGRDMTEYVEAYREYQCYKCPLMNDIFRKYEFER